MFGQLQPCHGNIATKLAGGEAQVQDRRILEEVQGTQF